MSQPKIYFLAKLLEAYRGHTVSIHIRGRVIEYSKIVRLSSEGGLVEIITPTARLLSDNKSSHDFSSVCLLSEIEPTETINLINRQFIPLVKIISVQLDDDGSLFNTFWQETKDHLPIMKITDGGSLVPSKHIDEKSWVDSQLDAYIRELGYRARERMYEEKLVQFFFDTNDDDDTYTRRITNVLPGLIFTNNSMVCVTSKIRQMIASD